MNDVSNDKLQVMPGYWFMYNMYALTRNARKYLDRDRRTEKIQLIEYNFLAPDTINEIFDALDMLQKLKPNEEGTATVSGWENTKRPTELLKVPRSIALFKELVKYYGTMELINHVKQNKFSSFDAMKKTLSAKIQRSSWLNIGGQLIQRTEVDKMKRAIRSGKIKSWDALHDFYRQQGAAYAADRLDHGYNSLLEILNITSKQFTPALFKQLLQEAVDTRQWMSKGILDSREKDHKNPFRKMVYDTQEEMNKVIGRLEDNSFIQEQMKELDEMKKQVRSIIKMMKLS
jgi:hypothetical protein